ncbi:MAG TPA: hypothetical protein DDW90_03330 [Cyanobacteria bacterium UBA9971]|nr:hypothetical protein [Cyanobacteria bacterium UBA9971]
MTLYFAQYFYWEQEHIIGVFADKEKSQEAINKFIAKNKINFPDDAMTSENCCCSIQFLKLL